MAEALVRDYTLNDRKYNLIIGGIIWIIFIGMGIFWFLKTGNKFFLFDLPYIGTSIALGTILGAVLPRKAAHYGRRVTQLLVGLYMLVYLGFFIKVNMQIESFFFYVLAGALGGAIIHYLPAKLLGPVIFNRGFCGWACWTAMVLDFLPWKTPKTGRIRGLGIIRYIHFGLSFGLVAVLFIGMKYFSGNGYLKDLMWLAVGNALYYSAGILLAFVLKDNRAFCKYLCPVPVLQKIMGRFSIFKIRINREKCIDCGICEKKCPMNIKLLEYSHAGKRVLSTECLLCNVCIDACPRDAVGMSAGIDAGFREHIQYQKVSSTRGE